MAKSLEQLLKEYGFSPKEIQVYMYLFKKGAATAQDIHKNTKVALSTCYDILENFRLASVVSYLESKPQKKYILESPRALENYIEYTFKQKMDTVKNDYENKKHHFKESLHKFLSAAEDVRPTVRFFEGHSGINELREDIAKSGHSVLYDMYNADIVNKIKEQVKGMLSPEAEKKLAKQELRDIYYSKSGDIYKDQKDHYFTDKAFEAEIFVYGDKVGMLDYNEKSATTVIIENKRIAESIKRLFDIAIEHLKK